MPSMMVPKLALAQFGPEQYVVRMGESFKARIER